jgi:hypothetical protein
MSNNETKPITPAKWLRESAVEATIHLMKLGYVQAKDQEYVKNVLTNHFEPLARAIR